MTQTFTPTAPCRCGFDGTGAHQCHAGRDPRYTPGRCQNEAVPRLVVTNPHPALAGAQRKVTATWSYYCPACYVEAFPEER